MVFPLAVAIRTAFSHGMLLFRPISSESCWSTTGIPFSLPIRAFSGATLTALPPTHEINLACLLTFCRRRWAILYFYLFFFFVVIIISSLLVIRVVVHSLHLSSSRNAHPAPQPFPGLLCNGRIFLALQSGQRQQLRSTTACIIKAQAARIRACILHCVRRHQQTSSICCRPMS